LWKWEYNHHTFAEDFTTPPTRLGIHNAWVAIANSEGGVVSLATDGSLWFWPDPESYEFPYALLKLPKQPKFLCNIFGNMR
jgi:hypothetical protein